MLPMSLWESGESSGTVSLGDLFAGRPLGPGKAIERSLSDVAYLICRGGWPQAVNLDGDVALDQAFDYVKAVANSDISRVDGVSRDPARARHGRAGSACVRGCPERTGEPLSGQERTGVRRRCPFAQWYERTR